MVEALKKDKFLSELPKEEIEMGEVDISKQQSAISIAELL